MLSLKVTYQSATQNKSTTQRFMQDMSVSEVCKQIKEKLGEGGADHGLFQPVVPGKNPARWLKPERTLQYYDLTSGDELYYRKKHRQIKVRLMDDTTKTMLIDDSLTVIEIVDFIGQKIDLKNAEEFSLQVVGREGQWLNPTLSLHENGVSDTDILILHKKFFFNDANVDKSDPVQLHLLYVQCRDSVVSGKLPVTRDEATSLAALQAQIQYGNYDPAKHKPGWLQPEQFLAPQHSKKTPEKNIFAEQKKLVGMSEVNAKYRYVQMCRSLKTYGITSYEVKEKKKNTRKMQDVLLGVTRDAILKMDPETKEVLKQWPLVHLRRWAASDKTFTLDFGDYEEDYMTLLTTEGEAVSQLIAGYIDIILKKRKDIGRVEREDDSMVPHEEMVAPVMAAAVTTMTSSIGLGGDAGGQAREGMLGAGQQVPGMSSVGGPQGLGAKGQQVGANKSGVGGSGVPITDLASALDATNLLIQELQNPGSAVLAPGDKTPEDWRKQIAVHANALAKTAAELMAAASKKDASREALDAIAKQLGVHIGNMVNAARHAAQNGDDDLSLLQGAKSVSEAIADMLKCAKAIADNPNNEPAREAMHHAAEALKAAQIFLASAMQGTLITDQSSQDLILESAKAVAAAASELCTTSYDAARGVPDPKRKAELTGTGKGTAAATNSLVSIAKAVAPGMGSQQVRGHFIELSKALGAQCGTLSAVFRQNVTDPSFLDRLAGASKDVNDAIAQLILATETADLREPNPKDFTPAAFAIASHVAQLMAANGNPQTIRSNTAGVQEQTARIIQSSKMLLPAMPGDLQKRLLAAAKALTEATSGLAPAAKEAAAKPRDADAQFQLRGAATTVGEHAQEMMQDGGKIAAMMTLRHVAKKAAADTTGLVATSRGVMNSINPAEQATRTALKKSCTEVQDATARLLEAVRSAAARPQDGALQAELLEQAKTAAINALNTVSVAKRAALKVMDPAQKAALVKSAAQASGSAQELLAACKLVDEIGQLPEVTNALEQLSSLESELDSLSALADAGYLQRTGTNVNRDEAVAALQQAAGRFQESNAELASRARSDPDRLGEAVPAHATNIAALATAAKDVAATSEDRTQQKKIIQAAKNVTHEGAETLGLASKVAQNPDDQAKQFLLEDSTKKGQAAVHDLLSAALGINTGEIDQTTELLEREAGRLEVGPAATAPGNYAEYADQLAQACRVLSASVASVVASAKMNPKGLGAATKMTATAIPPFVDVANLTAAANRNPRAAQAIIGEARTATTETAALLTAAKNAVAAGNAASDPSLPASQAAIQAALDRLLNIASPGKREVAEALQILGDARNRLIDPSNPGNGGTLDDLNKNTKRLAEMMQQVMQNARSNNPDRLGDNTKTAAHSVSSIVDATKALAAGVDSVSNEISAPVAQILTEAKVLRSMPNDAGQAVASAKNIATAASALAQVAKRMAASGAPNGGAAVANGGTAADGALSEERKAALLKATAQLAQVCATFGKTAKGNALKQVTPEATVGALRGVEEAARAVLQAAPVTSGNHVPRETAEKLQVATRGVTDATTVLVNNAGLTLARPGDATTQAALSASTAQVAESIAKLTAVAGSLLPGVKECDLAAEQIAAGLADIDSTLLQVAVGSLTHAAPPGKTYQECQEEMIGAARELAGSIQRVVNARANPAELGQAAEAIGNSMPRLVASTKNAVATTSNQKRQIELLKVAKDLAAGMLALVGAAKVVGAAPQDARKQQELIVASTGASQAIQRMVGYLKSEALSYRELDEAIAVLVQALADLEGPAPDVAGRNYTVYKHDVGKSSRDIAISVSNLCNAAKANIDGLGSAAKTSAGLVPRLVVAVRSAAALTEERVARGEITGATRDLVTTMRAILETAKALAADQKNAGALTKISAQHQQASAAITALLNAIKKGAKGERDTEQAIEEIGQVVADLDAAGLFAAANQLEVELPPGTTYASCEEALGKTAALVQAASGAVAQAASGASIEALGKAARTLATGVSHLGRTTKETSSQLPDMVAQQDLITAAKGVALSSQSLVAAAQQAQDKPQEGGGGGQAAELRSQLERVQQSVERLLATSQTAAAEAAKGVKALEAAQGAIGESLRRFDSSAAPTFRGDPSPQDVIAAARLVSAANAHMITGINSGQEDVAKAAGEMSASAEQILDTTKASFNLLKDKPAARQKLKESVRSLAQASSKLLQAAKGASTSHGRAESQQAVSAASSEVAERINDYVAAARELPGAGKISLQEEFGEDLDEMAEKELRNAAAVIERAAASLMNSKVRAGDGADINWDDMDVEDAILEAARAIAMATATLVKSAASAQRERVLAGRDPKTKHLYKKDPTWANGLISAAKTVAGTTQFLVTTANSAAQHKEGGDEEHLVACAKSVAAATAQLVAASKAKADPQSMTQKMLSDAAKSVANATSQLVNAAKVAAQREEDARQAIEASKSSSLQQRQIAEIEMQADILRLEKQLGQARQKLHTARKADYSPAAK